MKRYKLLKDLPDVMEGMLGLPDKSIGYFRFPTCDGGHITYSEDFMLSHSDWFEEVKEEPKEEPESQEGEECKHVERACWCTKCQAFFMDKPQQTVEKNAKAPNCCDSGLCKHEKPQEKEECKHENSRKAGKAMSCDVYVCPDCPKDAWTLKPGEPQPKEKFISGLVQIIEKLKQGEKPSDYIGRRVGEFLEKNPSDLNDIDFTKMRLNFLEEYLDEQFAKEHNQ